MHAAQVLGIQLNGRERVLDVVCHLPCHVRPRGQAVGSLQFLPLALQVGRHLVEGLDQPPQFVGRGRQHARIEIAAGNAPGGAHQPVDGIGDALGHVVADAGAEHDEEQRRQQHPAIQFLDLRLRLLLARRQRHRQHGLTSALDADRRGRGEVLEPAGLLAADIGRLAVEQDGAEHLAGRARRQQARGKQVAFARGQQFRALEDVDVLRDHAAEPHDDVVVDGRLADLDADVFDDAARHVGQAGRLAFDVGQHQRRHVGARHQSQCQHGDHRREHERQEELLVEAGTDLGEQRPPGSR